MTNESIGAGRIVTVFGGSGFIGRYAVGSLARDGWRVRIACRRPDLVYDLQNLGASGWITAVQANLRDPQSIVAALRGASAAVNMVGILFETSEQKFSDIQMKGAMSVAEAVSAAGFTRFVHFSALGANSQGLSAYARSKADGEAAVLAIVPTAVVVRPSVVFGPEDNFLNRFAKMAQYSPLIPIIGANTKFQPVYVGDVAEAVASAIAGHARPGKIYELGGPEVKEFRSILDFIMNITGHHRYVVELGFSTGKIMAYLTEALVSLSLGLFPTALRITNDQVELLKNDNIVSVHAIAEGRTLEGLGITPRSMEAIAPTYLYRYRDTGLCRSKNTI